MKDALPEDIFQFRVKAANDEHRETMEVSVQMQLLARFYLSR